MRPLRAPRIALALAGLAVALLTTAAVRAQSAGEWRSSRQVWREACGYCHNDRVAPELRGTTLAAGVIVSAVRAGPGGMPSFAPSELSDAELEQLAEWIVSQSKPSVTGTDRGARMPRHASRERPQ